MANNSKKNNTKQSTKTSASETKKGRPTKAEQAKKAAEKEKEIKALRARRTRAVVLLAFGMFFTVLAVYKGESSALAWVFMRGFMFGLLGMMSYLVGPALIILAICGMVRRTPDGSDAVRWSLLFLSASAVTYVFSINRPAGDTLWDKVKDLYNMGADEIGTGLVSAILGYPLSAYLGDIGGKVTALILLAASLMLVCNITPAELVKLIWKYLSSFGKFAKRKSVERKERKRLEYEKSISLETLRQDEQFEEKAKRIDIPLDNEERENTPSAGGIRSVFRPDAEKKRAEKNESLPSIDVDMGPPFDPSAEGIELNPTGPAASVVKDVLSKENETRLDNSRLFATFDNTADSRTVAEIESANLHFAQAKQEMQNAANEAAKEISQQYDPVDDEVAALAKKADSEYLKNQNTGSAVQARHPVRVYKAPPVALLGKQISKDEKSIEAELSQNAELLVKTLDSFNVHTKVVDISRGPTVTRYELQPDEGIRVSRIAQLSDDIALRMAAESVRIEAPIPGKAAVGIEIPNRIVQTVNLRPVIESEEFQKAKGVLTFALGKDVTGAVKVGDMEKMPHLLIAGATGMGKSVCINTIIMSLLYRCSPDELKLILVDPKMVEFTAYSGLPHLYLPVVTDPRKAAGALGWAVTEMLKRYRRFSVTGCRNITEYNKWVKKQLDDPNYEPAEGEEELVLLPRVVIIIDELADLMMAAPNEVEDAIARLAQMARAAGMHLILATQRPSVDVITGVIKNNIPSRIALAVSSQVDSRTILDGAGAEKLLGRGDMLYMPVGQTKSTRIQGCFVTDEEVARVVDYVKKHNGDVEYDDNVMKEIERATPVEKGKSSTMSDDDMESDTDDMFGAAVEVVLEEGQASTSRLQRKLKLGYARAARIMDEMEEAGIISAQDGSKPRQVLITKQQWLERKTTL